MFYLTTYSTHFIYGYTASVYGYTVKDHSDSERGNPVPPHGLLFPINSKGSFISIIHARISHTTAFVIPFVEHWLEREIAQWVLYEGVDPTTHRTMSERTLLPRSYISHRENNEWPDAGKHFTCTFG